MHAAHDLFALFGEESFHSVTQSLFRQMKEEIDKEDQRYLLGVNAAEYVDHVVVKYQLVPLSIDTDHPTISTREETRRSNRYNIYAGTGAGEEYRVQVITYHVPFDGDPRLLRYQPNQRTVCGRQGYVRDGHICFDVIEHGGGARQVDVDAKSMLACLRDNSSYLAQNISGFNQALAPQVKQIFEARRSELERRVSVVEALGVPIRKADSIPPTLAVPVARKRIPSPKPQPTGQSYKREWALDESIYQEILQTIHDTGRVFERLPSTYAGKDEETLRDHLILQLEPRFEWSATTGETFNKTGKTDILIRHEKEIVFVAECKFWGGRKQHFGTIDQILRYLTWRDSKTAIIYFVDTKEIAAPLKSIEDSTREHPCFVSFKQKREESRLDYEFHLPGDNDRIIRTAILCFHLPKQ